MSSKYSRVLLAGVLVIGMLSVFTAPAAAQSLDPEDPLPDTDDPLLDAEVGASDDPSLDLLVSILGGQVVEIDCEFSEAAVDNPQDVCTVTVAGQELPPETGGLPPEVPV